MSLNTAFPNWKPASTRQHCAQPPTNIRILLLTLCLCMKMAGPARANMRACASELKKRLTTWHSHKELNAILSSWDPVGYVLGLRREANDNARAAGNPVDVFV